MEKRIVYAMGLTDATRKSDGKKFFLTGMFSRKDDKEPNLCILYVSVEGDYGEFGDCELEEFSPNSNCANMSFEDFEDFASGRRWETNLVNSMDKVREGSFETPDDDPDGCLLIYKTTKDEAIATFGQEAYDRLVKNAVLHLNGKKGYTYSWSKD